MFNRLTDRLIHQRIGKKPLEVGADRIARTAHAARMHWAQLGKLNGAPPRLRGALAARLHPIVPKQRRQGRHLARSHPILLLAPLSQRGTAKAR